MHASKKGSIGIYLRQSRDDNGENIETIENQRDMLLAYAKNHLSGDIYDIYIDDNVSGSSFERRGLQKLKRDVLDAKISVLLLKDLSRLGRNNAKTLQLLDFLEENGIRIVCSDGRYDSMRDNDTVGIETWVNERYIRDLSRKIRSSLHFKIQRGEYIGNAPFGYFKADDVKNKLSVDESEAEVVRLIYKLYRSGMGYTSIASELNRRGSLSPRGQGWNRMAVRRILCSRVYIGDTVQGVSEKISFKSKKTRRLPQDEWVITEKTHEPIISKEEFLEVKKLRETKADGRAPNKGCFYKLRGIIWCGRCHNIMYARKRASGIKYVCGNYFRNGKEHCSSHIVSEDEIVKCICEEFVSVFEGKQYLQELINSLKSTGAFQNAGEAREEEIKRQKAARQRRQEILYTDRLHERISEQLFYRMNNRIEAELKNLEMQLERIHKNKPDDKLVRELIYEAVARARKGEISNEIIRLIVNKITVYDKGELHGSMQDKCVVIDFSMKNGV